jgi:hypothetical protein
MAFSLVMRKPAKGHTNAFTKALASGLLFCHGGNCLVPHHVEYQVSRKARFGGFFCVWGLAFLQVGGFAVRGNREPSVEHARLTMIRQRDTALRCLRCHSGKSCAGRAVMSGIEVDADEPAPELMRADKG